jgi:seryl-tRNA synthetase
MVRKTYAQVISDTEVMINGIRENEDVLAKRQIDRAFADVLQSTLDKAIALNNEQETLKAKLKEKTEQLDEVINALKKQSGEARKIIKLDMPQSSWREFGINDKR